MNIYFYNDIKDLSLELRILHFIVVCGIYISLYYSRSDVDLLNRKSVSCLRLSSIFIGLVSVGHT